jgi:hypothetical protein
VLIRGFTAWLLFFRDGSNNQLASAAPRQRPFSLRDGSSDKSSTSGRASVAADSILRDALWMVCAGLAIGAPLAFWGKRVAASLIPDLPVASLLPIVVAAAIMIAVGFIAAYLPARRVMRVDPMVALRYE